MPETADLILDARAGLGEGAVWDSEREMLYWVDINAGVVHTFDPATGEDRAISVGEPVGAVVPRRSGGLMLAVRRGFASLSPESGGLRLVCDPDGHNPELRFNDGKCDPAGRFWAGTITGRDKPGRAGLFCLFPDLHAEQKLADVTNSNGICWRSDGRMMYYIDTPLQRVDAFDFDPETGSISNRRPVVTVPDDMGHPDGMTIDAEEKLWVAMWGGGAVHRWDPDTGEHLGSVDVPASQVTSCAFGGRNLDELYITTARAGLARKELRTQPRAGGLFKAEPGVQGAKAFAFAG